MLMMARELKAEDLGLCGNNITREGCFEDAKNFTGAKMLFDKSGLYDEPNYLSNLNT